MPSLITPDRYLTSSILSDLQEKMVFISGPRQVGKTTLAKQIGHLHYQKSQYLNWDNSKDRATIRADSFGPTDLLILDEVHKYRPWKRLVKGIFDVHNQEFKILVTGSARLDVYRKGGDSLQGRYHNYRLHPLSVAEIARAENSVDPAGGLLLPSSSSEQDEAFDSLLRFGGFPEPFFKQNTRTLRRWQNDRVERLVREDIRDVESLRELSAVQLLVDILPSKVGSLLSVNSLRQDLEVTHKTMALWMEVLERFYYHFRIPPFASTKIRSLRKEPKLYLWDWSEVSDVGARLENVVASHLLKFCHFLKDVEGFKTELFFIRDFDQREVDFLVTIDRKPWFAVEVKSADDRISPALTYFGSKLKIPQLFQVMGAPSRERVEAGVQVVNVAKFLAALR